MLTRAKAVIIGAVFALTTLIGLATAPAASATGPQDCGYQVGATNLNVRTSPTTTARIVGQVSRAFTISAGPGCRSGFAQTVTGRKYMWQGHTYTSWARATFALAGKKYTGYVAKPGLYRCPQIVC